SSEQFFHGICVYLAAVRSIGTVVASDRRTGFSRRTHTAPRGFDLDTNWRTLLPDTRSSLREGGTTHARTMSPNRAFMCFIVTPCSGMNRVPAGRFRK